MSRMERELLFLAQPYKPTQLISRIADKTLSESRRSWLLDGDFVFPDQTLSDFSTREP